MSRDGSVGIVTGYGPDHRSSIPGMLRVRAESGAHPACYEVGIGGLVKQLGREAEHPSAYSAEAKNGGAICTSTHPYVFMAYIKHKGELNTL
jgi:hypothetical protein